MPHAYAQLAFTPTVRKLQEKLGSRGQYEFLDGLDGANSALSEREAAFIEARDTLFQATVSETGWPYVQHRGGPAGFIKVIDSNTIAFPDFRGNAQYLSIANLAQDDRISIILVDVAKQRRLKLLGHVSLVEAGHRPELFERLQLDGYQAKVERAFVVTVAAFDWNCPQHITPRFTEDEIAGMMAPLRARLERAEARVASLEKCAAEATPGNEAMGTGTLPVVVSGIRQLTPSVRAYELRHEQGQALPAFTPGAHVTVPVRLADGSFAARHYSICSSPDSLGHYEVAVLREPQGKGGSLHVHGAWTLGTRLRLDAPSNHFPMAASAAHSVLIAGGIGITPLKSMASKLAQDGQSFELHHAGRSLVEAPFAEQLTSELGHNYTFHEGGTGTRALFERLLVKGVEDNVHIYVCGPGAMIESLRRTALSLGVPSGQFHSERFSAPTTTSTDTEITVHLKRSGKTILVPAGESILEAVEREGIPAASSCRTGSCGTCTVRVLEGTPEHRDEFLSPEQQQSGQMCICVSRASTRALSIDL